jgi:hypothetical protein
MAQWTVYLRDNSVQDQGSNDDSAYTSVTVEANSEGEAFQKALAQQGSGYSKAMAVQNQGATSNVDPHVSPLRGQ